MKCKYCGRKVIKTKEGYRHKKDYLYYQIKPMSEEDVII